MPVTRRMNPSNLMEALMPKSVVGAALAVLVASCANSGVAEKAASQDVRPEIWPSIGRPLAHDPALEARIDGLLERMTLEEKVGQVIQADSNSITPEDLKIYKLGSILSGGNSAPNRQAYAAADEWLAMLDAYYDAAMDGPEGSTLIPPLFGIDAVHGHNNVVGATIFPHNIGLGAARNPKLVRRIAEATATQLLVTGHDWTFAPTLATPRDDRWGRTYEGFSESPEVVASYAGAIVEGLQGTPGDFGFLRQRRIISAAKHFIGDGGTQDGHDQGDSRVTEETLRDVHAAGYPRAITAGVQTVMASFSSWRGEKIHGHHGLLTDVLKERMKFDGFVVGDWNAHGQIEGCTNTDCPKALRAGVDMYMAPDSWRELYHNTLAQARSGKIEMARLDDAVRRILRVKLRAGLFEKGRPSTRPFAGETGLLASAEVRALARQAVRESLVLLKNNGGVLPLRADGNILVIGDAADDFSRQSGGWTLTWQGEGLHNDLFPNGDTVLDGVREAVTAAGGAVSFSASGEFRGNPDAAIIVFGEGPYAEFQGDLETVDFSNRSETLLGTMRRLRTRGVPIVAVFLTGRPLWVNPELNASDAFVVAWLPGTEGGGVADLLFRDKDGGVRRDFSGKLSFSWPATPVQTPLNIGDEPYEPLFAYGYGLSYADRTDVLGLPEDLRTPQPEEEYRTLYFEKGRPTPPWRFVAGEKGAGEIDVRGAYAETPSGALTIDSTDRFAQDDTKTIIWRGDGQAYIAIRGPAPLDLSRQANGGMALSLEARLDRSPAADVRLEMQCGEGCGGGVDISEALKSMRLGEWGRTNISLRCFTKGGLDPAEITTPFSLGSEGAFALSISKIELVQEPGDAIGCSAQ